MEALEQQIKKSGAISGLILGAIRVVLTVFNFYFVMSLTTSFVAIVLGSAIISYIMPVVLALLFTNDLRKRVGGFWTFKQATTGIFIMLYISYLLSFSANMVFNKFIEPNGIDKMKTAMVDARVSMMEKQNKSQDEIDKATADIEKNFTEPKDQSITKIVGGIGLSVIVFFVFALVLASFYKREMPLYQAPLDEPEPTV